MKSELNITPSGDTLTILEGKALDPKYPEKIKLSGNIKAIGAFLAARYGERIGGGLQRIDPSRAVIIVSREALTLELKLDPENTFGTEIAGKLEFTPELLQWNINGGKTFSRQELVKLIKFNGLNFADKDRHQELLKAYMSLDVSTTGSLQSASDTRGNKAIAFKKEVQSNVPTHFILDIPIFKGFPQESFPVEICLNATDAAVEFWFESTRLHDLIETRKEIIFNEELKACQDFVIIEK